MIPHTIHLTTSYPTGASPCEPSSVFGIASVANSATSAPSAGGRGTTSTMPRQTSAAAAVAKTDVPRWCRSCGRLTGECVCKNSPPPLPGDAAPVLPYGCVLFVSEAGDAEIRSASSDYWWHIHHKKWIRQAVGAKKHAAFSKDFALANLPTTPPPDYVPPAPAPEVSKGDGSKPTRDTLTFGKPGDSIICTFHLEGDRLVEWSNDHLDGGLRGVDRICEGVYSDRAPVAGDPLFLRGTDRHYDHQFEIITDPPRRADVLRWGASIDKYNAEHRSPSPAPVAEPVMPFGGRHDTYATGWKEASTAWRAHHLSTANALAEAESARDAAWKELERFKIAAAEVPQLRRDVAELAALRDRCGKADEMAKKISKCPEHRAEDRFSECAWCNGSASLARAFLSSLPSTTGAGGKK
jgi:hypothetical protein